jgi:uncharacterized protein (TIGR02145 family)
MDMKTKAVFILIGLMVLFFITCRKDKDDPAGGNKIELGVNLIDTVSYFFTGIQTEVISLGENEIIQHGHCWNTEPNPTIDESHTTLGKLSSEIDFLSTIDTLLPNTVYHIRPYIQTAYAVVYGEEEQIKTLRTGKPVVSTNLVSDITLTSALCGGIVTRDSGLVVTARGVCWDTTAVFRIDSCLGFTIDSLGLGSFSSEVTGLHEGTNYHITAYATNEKGTCYGEIISFFTATLNLPEVITSDISDITANSAQCGGNVISDGNGTLILRGVCWDTLSSPTFENNLGHTENGSELGVFTSSLTDLHDGKTYYISAFAINEKGVDYGEIKSFNTLQITIPTLTTSDVTYITINSALCGGNITDGGNDNIIGRGVCWSTNQNPTILDFHTDDGGGIGIFTSQIIDLNPNTPYFVRAYATNSEGTSYGNQLSFTTLPNPWQCGDQITYEGQTYNTLLIGDQCWFKENLNVGTMLTGSQFPSDNGVKEKYCYDDNTNNCMTYGGLYDWDEMMLYTTQQGTQGICPTGWHIPSDTELCTLTQFIDPTVNCNESGWSGNDVGTKMKSTTGWNSGGNGTNSSGFNAQPGGGILAGGAMYLGYYAYFWSSTESTMDHSLNRGLSYINTNVYRFGFYKYFGLSVRCVKD